MKNRKRRMCSKCGSKKVVPVVYGYPTEKLQELHNKGKVELGGCCITEDMPEFYCKACDDYCGLVNPDEEEKR